MCGTTLKGKLSLSELVNSERFGIERKILSVIIQSHLWLCGNISFICELLRDLSPQEILQCDLIFFIVREADYAVAYIPMNEEKPLHSNIEVSVTAIWNIPNFWLIISINRYNAC